MHVAITRAAPENARTAERIKERGATPILTPLLSIETLPFNANVTGAQALLFTSANGVRAFSAASPSRDLSVLTVGDATAQAARDAKFDAVHSADGDVAALAGLAKNTLKPAKGKLLYISAEDIAGDLIGPLITAGFSAERRIAYTARATAKLPPELTGALDIVLFHSARAAETFVRLGAPNAANLTAACLSVAVAGAARRAAWNQIIVAPAPREAALLDAILGTRHSPAGASA